MKFYRTFILLLTVVSGQLLWAEDLGSFVHSIGSKPLCQWQAGDRYIYKGEVRISGFFRKIVESGSVISFLPQEGMIQVKADHEEGATKVISSSKITKQLSCDNASGEIGEICTKLNDSLQRFDRSVKFIYCNGDLAIARPTGVANGAVIEINNVDDLTISFDEALSSGSEH